jgi:hypothetical protein
MTIDMTSADAVERMADLIRRQHPSLDTMRLEPVGKYQTRTVTLETLTNEVTAASLKASKDAATKTFRCCSARGANAGSARRR